MTRRARSADATPSSPARSWRRHTASVCPASRSSSFSPTQSIADQARAEQRPDLPPRLLVGLPEDVPPFRVTRPGRPAAPAPAASGIEVAPVKAPFGSQWMSWAPTRISSARAEGPRGRFDRHGGREEPERDRPSAGRVAPRNRLGVRPGLARARPASSSWRRRVSDRIGYVLLDRAEVEVLEVEAEVHLGRGRLHRGAGHLARLIEGEGDEGVGAELAVAPLHQEGVVLPVGEVAHQRRACGRTA